MYAFGGPLGNRHHWLLAESASSSLPTILPQLRNLSRPMHIRACAVGDIRLLANPQIED